MGASADGGTLGPLWTPQTTVCRVQGLGFRAGVWACGLGFRVWGFGPPVISSLA